MARFIDHAAALDVEIVDDWLFLYGRRAVLDPRPGDVGVAVLRRGRAPRQVRAVDALARRPTGSGCRSRGIRHVIVSRRHSGNRSSLYTACCAAPTSARGGATGPPSHSALRVGQWSVRRRVRGDLAVPADLGPGSSSSPSSPDLRQGIRMKRPPRWSARARAFHVSRRAACSTGSGTGSDASSRCVYASGGAPSTSPRALLDHAAVRAPRCGRRAGRRRRGRG